MVASRNRSCARRTKWAVVQGSEVVHAPGEFPEYGPPHYATYFLDPHGFMIEVVCHDAED